MAIVYHSEGLAVWQLSETAQELLDRVDLTTEQRSHFSEFRCEQHAGLWLSARVLTQELFGSTIGYHPSGAPYLVDSDMQISISHTSDLLVLGYSLTGIGVDVECVTRNASRVVSKFTTSSEIEIARELFPSNPELLVWCAKEAIYKRHGVEGLEFKQEILVHDHQNGTLKCSAQEILYECQIIEYKNYLITKVTKL